MIMEYKYKDMFIVSGDIDILVEHFLDMFGASGISSVIA